MHPQDTPPQTIAREKQLVKQLVPGVSDDDITLNNTGWDSRVYMLAGPIVFKFPRTANIKKMYQNEVAALKLAQSIRTDVQTPKVQWEHPQLDYIGYAGVPGQSLYTTANTLNPATMQTIGKKLGGFLKQLHQLRMPNARRMATSDEIKQFQQKYTEAQPYIQKHFTAAEQTKFQKLIFDSLPSTITALGSEPVLCHGDLGYWNIIYNQDGQVGVIDFGDIGYFDRSKDFMGLENPKALDAALAAYGDSSVLRQKIAARQYIHYILDLPFFMDGHDPAGLKDTVSHLRAAIN